MTGYSFESVNEELNKVKDIFKLENGSSIAEVTTLAGDVRPGEAKGHEQ